MTNPDPTSPRTSPLAAQASAIIDAGARALASHAAEILLDEHPEAEAMFGRRAFRGWHDHLTQRLAELSASVAVGSPERFRRDVAWSVAAFAARRVPTQAVAHSIDALRVALADALSPEAMAAVTPLLDAGVAAAAEPPAPMQRLSPDQPLGGLALTMLEAVLSGERRRAIGLLTDAADAGTPVAELYEQVLLPVEAEIGTMWHLGEISIPEEHAATEATRSAMAVLCHRAAPAQTQPGTVLVGAVEGDRHDIGPRAVADLVELAGFRVICLGGDVPVRDLLQACSDFEATALILSATMTVHLPALAKAIDAVRVMQHEQERSLRIIVGGQAFASDPALSDRLGANGYAASPRDAIGLLRSDG